MRDIEPVYILLESIVILDVSFVGVIYVLKPVIVSCVVDVSHLICLPISAYVNSLLKSLVALVLLFVVAVVSVSENIL